MTTMPKTQIGPQNVESDLHDARTLLSDSRKVADGEKYRKAAKIILLKVLYMEPAHAEASALLAEAMSSARSTPALGAAHPEGTAAPAVKAKAPTTVGETPFIPQPQMPRDELRFTTSYAATQVEKKSPPAPSATVGKLLPAVTIIAFLAGGWFFIRSHTGTTIVQAKTAAPSAAPVAFANSSTLLSSLPAAPALPESEELAVKDATLPISTPAPVNTSPVEVNKNPAPRATGVQEPGSLAVSSAIAADIYMDEKYVGSTPTTLNLPAGPNTLEYRHGTLRTVMTHVIKSKETSTALVSFDTTVQINARPWAQVFVEGAQRRALGQTPLGAVRVPIGSVLTFENPSFPAKSYRITEKDSSIQIVFP